MLHVFHMNYLSRVVDNCKFNLELWINETYIYGRPLGSRSLRMMTSIKYAHGIHEPYFVVRFLIHNGRDKVLDIVRTTFSNAFSWMKMYGFRLRFHWSFFPNGPINNISALVQIMVCRRPGGKPSSQPMMLSLLTHICVTWPQWVKPASHCSNETPF